MAPSSGQVFVPKAVKAFKYMLSKGAAYLRARAQEAAAAGKQVEAIPIRLRQPLHPVAALRQRATQQRNFSTAIRRVVAHISRPVQASRPIAGTAIRSAISRSAPFSSPLRPNLTGGAIPRSSGGYTLGGNGVRHFSSAPASQAHVVQNVSAALRAFCLNGYKAQYDGTDLSSGVKRFRAVSATQEKALSAMRMSTARSKGTTLEFRIAPTITAVPSLERETSLESDVISDLASDFAKSLRCLAAVHADLKKLSTLGALPITYPDPHTLNVRFAGCDAKSVYALCDELGIQRGIVREDPEWAEDAADKDVEMALLFPWAPSLAPSHVETDELFVPAAPRQSKHDLEWHDMLSPSLPMSKSQSKYDDFSIIHSSHHQDSFADPWQSLNHSPSYDALNDSDIESNEELALGMDSTRTDTIRPTSASAYEGMEGVLRFLEQCEGVRR